MILKFADVLMHFTSRYHVHKIYQLNGGEAKICSASTKCVIYLYHLFGLKIMCGALAEWLKRLTRNQFPSGA